MKDSSKNCNGYPFAVGGALMRPYAYKTQT